MKLETIQEFIKGKDLAKESTQQELVDLINSDTNSIVKAKKEKFAQELDEKNAKLAEANLSSKKLQSDIETLNTKISEQESLTNKLNTKLYISNKSKGRLDNQAMDDVIILANTRVNNDKSKTKEQAIDEVLSLYFNKEEVKPEVQKPKVKWTSSSPSNQTAAGGISADLKNSMDTNKAAIDKFKSKVGIGQTKSNLFNKKV